ncbi:MAG TPA: BadF/BadG/BcrA/BcrD ATPase family protein [Pyrinomonadaceae bacterium]|nr:BadF/BadG/BcrA/BcrD ATPase family protein [Pyrinomonadaceae bacterium]
MGITDRRSAEVRAAPQVGPWEVVVGVDGGGSNTTAVVMDVERRVIGEGTAGPSNPLRIGVASAAAAVREAVDKACEVAQVRRADVRVAKIGLAGARRKELRARMRDALNMLGVGEIDVVTDAEIALHGATDGKPGLVVIAGTGSVCCGVNAKGKRKCAGGWGPVAGDEGGGAWLARRALRAIAHASDGRGPQTLLVQAACSYFHVSTADDLSTAIYAPTMTNERIAGFGKHVIEAATQQDEVAIQILADGGLELGLAAVAVIHSLKLEKEHFQVAYVGGVFASGGELILRPMREQIQQVAPAAFLAPPRFAPAVAAARMAREYLDQVAVAV